MSESETQNDVLARQSVRTNVVGFFATIGVVIGLVIVDSKVEEIVGFEVDAVFPHGAARFGAAGQVERGPSSRSAAPPSICRAASF